MMLNKAYISYIYLLQNLLLRRKEPAYQSQRKEYGSQTSQKPASWSFMYKTVLNTGIDRNDSNFCLSWYPLCYPLCYPICYPLCYPLCYQVSADCGHRTLFSDRDNFQWRIKLIWTLLQSWFKYFFREKKIFFEMITRSDIQNTFHLTDSFRILTLTWLYVIHHE